MTTVVKCSYLDLGCNFETRTNSACEVLKKADEQAKTADNMQDMSPDVLSKVPRAIHDKGEMAAKKASA